MFIQKLGNPYQPDQFKGAIFCRVGTVEKYVSNNFTKCNNKETNFKVRVFAGVEQLRNGGTRPAATGRLCEWKEDPR